MRRELTHTSENSPKRRIGLESNAIFEVESKIKMNDYPFRKIKVSNFIGSRESSTKRENALDVREKKFSDQYRNVAGVFLR